MHTARSLPYRGVSLTETTPGQRPPLGQDPSQWAETLPPLDGDPPLTETPRTENPP